MCVYANSHIAPPVPTNIETTILRVESTVALDGGARSVGASTGAVGSGVKVGLLVTGAVVGSSVIGASEGEEVGSAEGDLLGEEVGLVVGSRVLGLAVGGCVVVGNNDGGLVGWVEVLGLSVGLLDLEGALVVVGESDGLRETEGAEEAVGGMEGDSDGGYDGMAEGKSLHMV